METSGIKTCLSTTYQKIAQFFSSIAAKISAFAKSFFAKKAEQPESTPAPVAGRNVTVETEAQKDTVPTPAPEPESKPAAEPTPKLTPKENARRLAAFQRKHAPEKPAQELGRVEVESGLRISARLAAKKK